MLDSPKLQEKVPPFSATLPRHYDEGSAIRVLQTFTWALVVLICC